MATGGDDREARGKKGLRVASRAVRRGRKLRPSLLPAAPSNDGDALTELDESPEGDADGRSSASWEGEGDEYPSRPSFDDDSIAPSLSNWNMPQFEASDSPFADPSLHAHESDFPEDEEPLPLSRPAGDDELRIDKTPASGALATTSSPASQAASLGTALARPYDAPSIRVRETASPPDLDDLAIRSARLSRPPAPMMGLAGKRQAPDSEAPDSEAPESEAPESEAPESEAPESEAPESEAPDSEARSFETRGTRRFSDDGALAAKAKGSATASRLEDSQPPRSSERDSEPDDFVFQADRGTGGVRPWMLAGIVLALAGAVWVSRRPTKPSVESATPVASTSTGTATLASATPSTVASSATPAATASTDSSSTAVATAASAPPDSSSAAPASSVAAIATSEDYDALLAEFVSLHNKRRIEECEVVARRMVELRPRDATGYRCLGAALQDQSRLREARENYSECVSRATEGDVAECSKLGGTLRSIKN